MARSAPLSGQHSEAMGAKVTGCTVQLKVCFAVRAHTHYQNVHRARQCVSVFNQPQKQNKIVRRPNYENSSGYAAAAKQK